MRSLFLLLCVALAVIVPFSVCFGAAETLVYEHTDQGIVYDSERPVFLSWLAERYDLDWIGEYVDEYYVGHYKYWGDYLVNKQHEVAEKFFLSDIYFKPDLSRYDRTKIALTRNFWDDRIKLRYFAPVGDLRDCEFSCAVRPYQSVTFIMRGQINGERRIALVINRPLGNDKYRSYETKKLRRLIRNVHKFAN